MLDHEALESAAAQVDTITANFTAELSSLGSLVSSTHEFWNDPAQVSFEAKYNEFKTAMSQFCSALELYSKGMKDYAARSRSETSQASRVFENI